MNCPNCEYVYNWEHRNGKKRIIVGDEEFGKTYIKTDQYEYNDNGILRYRKEEINICPKCGILFRG